MLRLFFSLIATTFSAAQLFAQRPENINIDDTPLEFTPLNIVIFIVLPILLLIFYVYWRRSKRNDKND